MKVIFELGKRNRRRHGYMRLAVHCSFINLSFYPEICKQCEKEFWEWWRAGPTEDKYSNLQKEALR